MQTKDVTLDKDFYEKNYHSYNYFGNHNNIINKNLVSTFRVWAPNARSVSLVGDFNHWDRNINKMNKLNKTGTWEIHICPHLPKYTIYSYSITTYCIIADFGRKIYIFRQIVRKRNYIIPQTNP